MIIFYKQLLHAVHRYNQYRSFNNAISQNSPMYPSVHTLQWLATFAYFHCWQEELGKLIHLWLLSARVLVEVLLQVCRYVE